jgi:hypothetical protein
MTTQHTAGPWGCTYTSSHAHDYRITGANGFALPLKIEANDHSEQRANARLIAAAPELLEALYAALPFIEDAEADKDYKAGAVAKVTKQLREAIAKATGERREGRAVTSTTANRKASH